MLAYLEQSLDLPHVIEHDRFEAGTEGRPGIVMISPQMTTTNPAPALRRTSRTGTEWPRCRFPRRFGSVVKLYCVFAIQTGKLPYPAASILSADCGFWRLPKPRPL